MCVNKESMSFPKSYQMEPYSIEDDSNSNIIYNKNKVWYTLISHLYLL